MYLTTKKYTLQSMIIINFVKFKFLENKLVFISMCLKKYIQWLYKVNYVFIYVLVWYFYTVKLLDNIYALEILFLTIEWSGPWAFCIMSILPLNKNINIFELQNFIKILFIEKDYSVIPKKCTANSGTIVGKSDVDLWNWDK